MCPVRRKRRKRPLLISLHNVIGKGVQGILVKRIEGFRQVLKSGLRAFDVFACAGDGVFNSPVLFHESEDVVKLSVRCSVRLEKDLSDELPFFLFRRAVQMDQGKGDISIRKILADGVFPMWSALAI